MSDSKLIYFFNEMSNITEFERKRKIYELTNNLDIDLLFDLNKEYEDYVNAVVQKIECENGIDNEPKPNGLRKLGLSKFERNNIYIDTYLKDNKDTDIEKVKKNGYRFLDTIYDLIRRKVSDLPKNSRQRNNFNFHFNYKKRENVLDLYSHNGSDELGESDELIDLSDNTIVGKVIYLEKLGIIDYLRTQKPFNTSVNSIATVFSAITGAKATSLQPMLNPLLSRDVYSKNNPLNSQKNVITAENILMNMGFEFNKKK